MATLKRLNAVCGSRPLHPTGENLSLRRPPNRENHAQGGKTRALRHIGIPSVSLRGNYAYSNLSVTTTKLPLSSLAKGSTVSPG